MLPHLNTANVMAYIEETLSDVLHLIVSFGQSRITDLSDYAQHGLLTFGVIINNNKPGILAHLPSTPSPEWYCHSVGPDVKVSYSRSGHVDLVFHKTADIEVHLEFGLHIPANNCNQLGCTYLSQSLHFCAGSDNVEDVVYVDRIGFNLTGTFLNDPNTSKPPAYLFVPPLHTELINNLHCVHHPFPQQLFHWAHDQQGKNVIAEKDWEKLGIPKLKAKERIGTHWDEEDYTFIQDYLSSKNYNLDGRQYVCDHGYPALIFADPHGNQATRIRELEHLLPKSKTSPSPPQLTLPSLPSCAPEAAEHSPKNMPTLPGGTMTHWAQPVFSKWYNSVLETMVQEAETLEYSVVAC
ncbi:hypothetical protein PQX77_003565 [Marasmius sp. AFHP31]|nr:hypothetical protein PQX77_003565 [Marasmius sp. AFHP31]